MFPQFAWFLLPGLRGVTAPIGAFRSAIVQILAQTMRFPWLVPALPPRACAYALDHEPWCASGVVRAKNLHTWAFVVALCVLDFAPALAQPHQLHSHKGSCLNLLAICSTVSNSAMASKCNSVVEMFLSVRRRLQIRYDVIGSCMVIWPQLQKHEYTLYIYA